MDVRIARLTAAAVVVAALALPAMAAAADPDPVGTPPAVIDWQVHLDHMRSMDGTPGDHVAACAEVHGSMGGMFGPNGSMVEMMGEGMMR
jgi:hypothetical protein